MTIRKSATKGGEPPVAGSPFEPVHVTPAFPAPQAGIDPDPAKGWLRRLLPLVFAHKWIFILSLVCAIFAMGLQVLVPWLV